MAAAGPNTPPERNGVSDRRTDVLVCVHAFVRTSESPRRGSRAENMSLPPLAGVALKSREYTYVYLLCQASGYLP